MEHNDPDSLPAQAGVQDTLPHDLDTAALHELEGAAGPVEVGGDVRAWVKSYQDKIKELQPDQKLAGPPLKVVLRDGEVRIRRVLVAALSHPFYCMLTRKMNENIKGVVEFDYLSKEDWHCVLRFYQSGDNLISADNSEVILQFAHVYDMKDLREHSERVLVETLTSANCCDRLTLCKSWAPNLTESVMGFIKKNLKDVCLSENFKSISKENLLYMMRCDEVITTEESLCTGVLHWLKYHSSDDNTTSEVLSLIKLEDLSTQYIHNDLMCHSKVKGNNSMQGAIDAELKERCEFYKGSLHCDPHYRLPKGETLDVIVLGHDSLNNKLRLFYCQKTEKRWLDFSPRCKGRLQCGAVMVKDKIIITGGIGVGEETLVFDIPSQEWSVGPKLGTRRHSHAMALAGESALVIAGQYKKGKWLKSIEKLEGDRWSNLGYLEREAGTPGVAVIKQVLLVVGGSQATQLIQTFDLKSGDRAVLETRLPFPLCVARGALLERNTAVFMGRNKTLVFITYTAEDVEKERLVQGGRCGCGSDSKEEISIILAMEGRHLLCIEGTEKDCSDNRVHRYSLRGNPLDADDFPTLPAAVCVQNAFLFPLTGMPRLKDH